MNTSTEATIQDLYQAEGKAEIINGEIVLMSPTGSLPGYAGDEVFTSLREYSKENDSQPQRGCVICIRKTHKAVATAVRLKDTSSISQGSRGTRQPWLHVAAPLGQREKTSEFDTSSRAAV